MSTSGTIIAALLTAVATDLSEYLTRQGFYTDPSRVDVEDLPFFMIYNPAEARARGTDDGAIVETMTVEGMLIRKKDQDGETFEVDQLRDDLDAIQTRFDTDARVSSNVDWAVVTSTDTFENLTDRTAALITITTVRTRP